MTSNNQIKDRMKTGLQTYCIIGNPISHSLSPVMQNTAFKELGLNCNYFAFRVSHEDLKSCIDSFRSLNISGFNVTIPHKVSIIKYLDYLDESASKAAAVNTVKNINGKLWGYNTDIYGFMFPLRKRNFDFTKKNILIIGAGGSSRAIITGLSEEKDRISKIFIVNRTISKAMELTDFALKNGLNCEFHSLDEIKNYSLISHLIVNTTSMGMNNEESLLDSKSINKNSIVFDIVYNPIYTNLIQNAKHAQSTIIFGYEMLLFQGVKAFQIWTGLKAPVEAMKKSLLGIFGEPK